MKKIKEWFVATRIVIGIILMELGAKMIGEKNYSWKWEKENERNR